MVQAQIETQTLGPLKRRGTGIFVMDPNSGTSTKDVEVDVQNCHNGGAKLNPQTHTVSTPLGFVSRLVFG